MERRTFLSGSAAALAMLRVPRLARGDGGTLLELTSRPANYEAVRETFTTRITPLERFYIRNHFDAPADLAAWKLDVSGLVDRPQALALADLAKLPQVTVEAVLQCAGNGRGLFTPRVPGVQWRWGAMGNATWTGPRLADVLAAAGVGKDARYVQLQGLEKPTSDRTPAFIRGIPIAKALHPDTIVALRMNGRPLSPLHGAPARLVVPGWVGDDWVKWLAHVELRADEPKGYFYESAYRFPTMPGPVGQPVPPEQTRPMQKLVVKSLIGSLSGGEQLVAGTPRELVGVAFSGEARIAKVEITVDGGATWKPAKLEADSAYGFRVFRYSWTPATGAHRVAAKATDTVGATQPAAPVWNPSGYLYNAIEYLAVEARP
jgi:DMSO/TMAO reductase YedYZ molybdopterin-dependent catalytic subunit